MWVVYCTTLPVEQKLPGGWDSCVLLMTLFLLASTVPGTSCILNRKTEWITSQALLIPYGSQDTFFFLFQFSFCQMHGWISYLFPPKNHLCHLNQTSRMHLWLLSSHLLGHQRHSPRFWLSVIFYSGPAHRCWTFECRPYFPVCALFLCIYSEERAIQKFLGCWLGLNWIKISEFSFYVNMIHTSKQKQL